MGWTGNSTANWEMGWEMGYFKTIPGNGWEMGRMKMDEHCFASPSRLRWRCCIQNQNTVISYLSL